MKVGVIGCGGIAPAHVGAYKRIEGVEVVGVCDLNLVRAKELADKFRVKKTFTNYWDLLDTEKPDLVDICTPVSTHAAIVCDVAKAVPAILVEKPMAFNVEQCDSMIKEVKKHGTKLCIGHAQIFSPHIMKAKALVDSGQFNLLSFETIQKESFELLKSHNLAPAWNVTPDQRGIIWEVCSHLAYLQLHFLPDIEEVYAVGGKVKYPVYDNFAVLLRTKSQRFGLIELSWVSKETDIVYELSDISGKRLQIHRDFDYMLEKSEEPVFSIGDAVRNSIIDEKRVIQKWASFGSSYFRKRRISPVVNLINEFVHRIKIDMPPPVTPEDGRNNISLLESIEKSLDTNQPVMVNVV